MTKTLLAALIFGLSAAPVIAQTSDETPRPLVEWDLTDWNPESQAACGVFMTRFGLIGSASKHTNAVFQILARGLAVDGLSKNADLDLNTRAWSAPVNAVAGDNKILFEACAPLISEAIERGDVPQDVLYMGSEVAGQIIGPRR